MKLNFFQKKSRLRPVQDCPERIDALCRSLLATVGPGDWADNCDELVIYCSDQVKCESLRDVDKHVMRTLANEGGFARELAGRLSNGHVSVTTAPAPDSAIKVPEEDGVSYVLRHGKDGECKCVITNRDGKKLKELLDTRQRVIPCRIGRNSANGRVNDIVLTDMAIGRRQGVVYWENGRPYYLAESNTCKTWINSKYLTTTSPYELCGSGEICYVNKDNVVLKFEVTK